MSWSLSYVLGREESELFILEVDGICLVQTKDLRSGEVNPLPPSQA